MRKANLIARAVEWVNGRLFERRGKEYQPFLTVRDVPSKGVRSKLISNTVGRTHHLMSLIEAANFYSVDSRQNVTDIREQNLIPPEVSRDLARELGIRHPSYQGELHPMTLDLWVSYRDRADAIFSVKQSSDLNDRTVAKLQLEHTYAESQGATFRLVTERQFNAGYIKALQWILPMADAERLPEIHMDIDTARHATLQFILLNRGRPLNQVCAELDRRLGQRAGCSLAMVRHLIAIRSLRVDISEGIDTLQPLQILDWEDLQ